MPRGYKQKHQKVAHSGSESPDDFKESDCESDFEEQLVAARQLKRQKREERAVKEGKMIIPKSYLPSQ
jgi:RNA polymerase subunit RPABC4/transcription elongation factor Spt4